MKIVRKQIGIKIGIDQETGSPSIEPLFETKIQPPLWKVVLKECWFIYVVTLFSLIFVVQSISIQDPVYSCLSGAMSSLSIISAFAITQATINEN